MSAGASRLTGAPDFARAVAFYPGCRTPMERGWADRVPLLILIGAADDWTDAASCVKLVAAAKARKEAVKIKTYPGAYHDFDHPSMKVHVRTGLAFTASGDGTAHVGTNPAARADALKRVPVYLLQTSSTNQPSGNIVKVRSDTDLYDHPQPLRRRDPPKEKHVLATFIRANTTVTLVECQSNHWCHIRQREHDGWVWGDNLDR